MHVPDGTDLAAQNQRASLLHLRIEADVEVRAVHNAALDGQLEQLSRLIGGHSERLLADDVLARLERLLDLRIVELVRRRQMDDVHTLVAEQLLVALDDGPQKLRPRALRRRADHPDDLHTEPPQRFHVDGTDEPGSDDAGTQLPDLAGHADGSSTSKSTSMPYREPT